jgi:hypothetical protein
MKRQSGGLKGAYRRETEQDGQIVIGETRFPRMAGKTDKPGILSRLRVRRILVALALPRYEGGPSKLVRDFIFPVREGMAEVFMSLALSIQ